MEKEEIFKTTLGIRNFEIDLFWKRSNYFLVLNTTIAVGYFTINPGYALGISILGLWICVLWFAVTLGGKFWQSRWEQQLTEIEKKLNLDVKLFTASRKELQIYAEKSLSYNDHSWIRRQFDKLVLLRFSVSYMMTMLAFSFIVFWSVLVYSNINLGEWNLLQNTIAQSSAEANNIYWLFSASAQSISAFLAFLLTGFAIVLSMMTTLEQKDETLDDILHTLKVKYYKIITVLSLTTGIAIILSLYSVFINGSNMQYKNFFYIAASILDVIAILGGILFMIYIINPNKYKNLANKLYEKEKKNISEQGEEVDGIVFLQKFIQLEKLIRKIVEGPDIYVDKQFTRRPTLALREMIEIIWRNEFINKELYEKMMEINKKKPSCAR